MISVLITDGMVRAASDRAMAVGCLNNSITKGEGNIAGFLGEIVVAEYLGLDIVDNYGYDLLLEGYRFEVKSRRRTVEPKPYYFVGVAATSMRQCPDVYVFVDIMWNNSKYLKAFIDGWIYVEEFKKVAKFYKKGEKEVGSSFIEKADCYKIRIDQLKDIAHWKL